MTAETRVPDLTGTWWQSRRYSRRIHLVGRIGSDRFIAHIEQPNNRTKTYRVNLYTLQGEYRQIPDPG